MAAYKLICETEERDDVYTHLGTAKKAARELSLEVECVVEVFDIENHEIKATYKNGELFKVFEQEYESDSSLFTMIDGEECHSEPNVESYGTEQEERNVDSTLKCAYMIQCTNTLTGKKSFLKSIGAEKVHTGFNSEEEAETFLADVKSKFPHYLKLEIICLTN